MTFVEAVIAGQAKPEDIDDYVEIWHDDVVCDDPLHEFLGMTVEEYAAWVQDESALAGIIEAHRRRM